MKRAAQAFFPPLWCFETLIGIGISPAFLSNVIKSIPGTDINISRSYNTDNARLNVIKVVVWTGIGFGKGSFGIFTQD